MDGVSPHIHISRYYVNTYIPVHGGITIHEFCHGVIRVGLALALQTIISLFMTYNY